MSEDIDLQRVMECLRVDRRRVKRWVRIRVRLSGAAVRRRVLGQAEGTDWRVATYASWSLIWEMFEQLS